MGPLTLLFVVASATVVCAADLYANTVTGSDTSEGRQYTVTYISSRPAVVLWGDLNQLAYFQDDPNVNITSTYSNGQGVSTMILSQTVGGFMFALLGSDSFMYYYFQDFIGQKNLPEVELESLNGDVLDYIENETLSFRLQYSNLPSGYSSGQFLYFFQHISSRDNPVLETASSFGPSTSELFTNTNNNVTGNHTVMSVDINLGTKEGVSLSMIYYTGTDPEVAIFRGTNVALKQFGHQSPFPDGFIGLAVSNTGSGEPECVGSVCRFYCDAYGSDIVDVQVRRKDDGEVVEPLYELTGKWYVTSEYQRPAEDYGQTFVCSATNAAGQTAEKEVKMHNE